MSLFAVSAAVSRVQFQYTFLKNDRLRPNADVYRRMAFTLGRV